MVRGTVVRVNLQVRNDLQGLNASQHDVHYSAVGLCLILNSVVLVSNGFDNLVDVVSLIDEATQLKKPERRS